MIKQILKLACLISFAGCLVAAFVYHVEGKQLDAIYFGVIGCSNGIAYLFHKEDN